MLQNFLIARMDDLPINYLTRCYFQQDGCPGQFSNAPVLWPPKCSDLTSADFYLWNRLKEIVYENGFLLNAKQLKERIRYAVASLSVGRHQKVIKNYVEELSCASKMAAYGLSYSLHALSYFKM